MNLPGRIGGPIIVALALASMGSGTPARADGPAASGPAVRFNAPSEVARTAPVPAAPAPAPTGSGLDWRPSAEDFRALRSVALVALASLLPAVVLMFTPFVRIHIALVLLRQALGSQQVPGNQVLAAVALLLTALIMKPVGETVYKGALAPYAVGQLSASEAWEAGTRPVKNFMVDQIERTGHKHYLWDLYDFDEPPGPGRLEPRYRDDFSLRVVAPAFLLSELTTALKIGFVLYLPFLVVDLVVSAVLSAMGLFMLPPSLVALPLKLILFVLADGWLLVATSLLRTFAV
jgi:flagellar biosynthesis protein FliP